MNMGRDIWIRWDWEPEAPNAWAHPERTVVIVEGLHRPEAWPAPGDAAPCRAASALRRAVVECGVVAIIVEHPDVHALWQEDPCPRFVPALRAQRWDDLTTSSAKTLAAVPVQHRALVLSPREMIDLFRVESSGRDTDRNWIAYTNVLDGFRYDGAYNVTDPNAYTHWRPVDLVIVHGSTGAGVDPLDPAAVALIRSQCEEAGVAFAFAGWGEPGRSGRLLDGREHLALPEDLR